MSKKIWQKVLLVTAEHEKITLRPHLADYIQTRLFLSEGTEPIAGLSWNIWCKDKSHY